MTEQELLTQQIGLSYKKFDIPILNKEPIWALLNVNKNYQLYVKREGMDVIRTITYEQVGDYLTGNTDYSFNVLYLCEVDNLKKEEVQPVFEKSEDGEFTTPQGTRVGTITSEDQIASYQGMLESTIRWDSIPGDAFDEGSLRSLNEEHGEKIYVAFKNNSFNLYRISIWTKDELVSIIDEIKTIYIIYGGDNDTIIETSVQDANKIHSLLSKFDELTKSTSDAVETGWDQFKGEFDKFRKTLVKHFSNTIITGEDLKESKAIVEQTDNIISLTERKTVWDLAMHEGIKISQDLWATRVPGGWLYDTGRHESNYTFVPYQEQTFNIGCALCGNTIDKNAKLIVEVLDHLNDTVNQLGHSNDLEDHDKLLAYVKEYLKK